MTILRETFCVYCQEEKGGPQKLQAHLLRSHKNTYAAVAVIKARADAKKKK